ncbi:unnamed protein product, partial [Allacma fusca]
RYSFQLSQRLLTTSCFVNSESFRIHASEIMQLFKQTSLR